MENVKQVILHLVADLSSPIDPHLYAGYGSEFENKRLSTLESIDNIGAFYIVEENHIKETIDTLDINNALAASLEIALDKPKDYMNGLPIRRSEEWDYCLAQVIDYISKKLPDEFIRWFRLSIAKEDVSKVILLDLLHYMDEAITKRAVSYIIESKMQLTPIETEVLNEIKKEFKL